MPTACTTGIDVSDNTSLTDSVDLIAASDGALGWRNATGQGLALVFSSRKHLLWPAHLHFSAQRKHLLWLAHLHFSVCREHFGGLGWVFE